MQRPKRAVAVNSGKFGVVINDVTVANHRAHAAGLGALSRLKKKLEEVSRGPPVLRGAHPMICTQTDPVKQQVAAHWDRRAAHFDEDFGHSIRTAAERAAWDRILDLILPTADTLEAPLERQA